MQNKAISGVKQFDEKILEDDTQLTKIFKKFQSTDQTNLIIWCPEDMQFSKASESDKCILEKDWEKTLTSTWENDYHFKIYKPLELKGHPPEPCLFNNFQNELMIYKGKNKDVSKPVWILNIM